MPGMAISVCTRQCCIEGCLGRGGSGGFCGTRGYARGPFMNDLTQTPDMLISNMGQRARRAAALLAGASDAQRAQALRSAAHALRDGEDRKSVVEGKSVSVRVDPGGRRNIKQKKQR